MPRLSGSDVAAGGVDPGSGFNCPRVHASWCCELNREGILIGRDRCERLMKAAGITGVVRGRRSRTTTSGRSSSRAPDLVDRDWDVAAPNRVWVSDFAYMRSWAAMVYVAFVIDVHSRRIVSERSNQPRPLSPPRLRARRFGRHGTLARRPSLTRAASTRLVGSAC